MFRLDEKNHSAIYIQIMDNIKEMIVTDVWRENEKIPSVRELSEQLTLNPNTVQKRTGSLSARVISTPCPAKGLL